MWAEKNNRAIKFLTARPNGILRGGLGSQNRKLKSNNLNKDQLLSMRAEWSSRPLPSVCSARQGFLRGGVGSRTDTAP